LLLSAKVKRDARSCEFGKDPDLRIAWNDIALARKGVQLVLAAARQRVLGHRRECQGNEERESYEIRNPAYACAIRAKTLASHPLERNRQNLPMKACPSARD
jgi:hypothetical protein